MRHGIDKDFARRLAHFYQDKAPQPKEPEQEPLEYWNAVEGWVKIDEVREHFDSVGCATIYKTAGEGRVPLSLCKAQPDNTAKLYEELRSIIDGGSESFTHEDAVQYLKNKLAQPTQDWIKRERAFGYREGHQNALKQMAQPEQRSVSEHLGEPEGYVQTVIEALYENSDPVSVDAAELLERISIKEGQIEDLTYKADYWKRMQDEVRAQWIKDTSIKQEQGEPVAWMKEQWSPDCGPYVEIYRDDEMGWRDPTDWTPLYTTPQQRTWVGLEDDEIMEILKEHYARSVPLIYAIEDKLKAKNT